jgi:uncharacterized membrane protein
VRHRFRAQWYELQDTLWFIPAIMTVAGVLLALLTVWVDEVAGIDQRIRLTWLFGGGAEGARGVLSTIAGTMITVTGLVFSITIVALQLASSQFTPRVLRHFTGDRGNQVVLGVFIATFTYCLLVLRSVHSAAQDLEIFVPTLSVTVAIGLALLCIGFLIYYIHHAARSIQASVIIERAAGDMMDTIRRLLPEKGDDDQPAMKISPTLQPETSAVVIVSGSSGYLQSMDDGALFHLAQDELLHIRIVPGVGDFVLAGEPVAYVWPVSLDEESSREALRERIEGRIRRTLFFGVERILAEDLAFGFRQIADIALKALSAAINDPTTATMCIDRLCQALVVLDQRDLRSRSRHDEGSNAVLIVPGPSFDRLAHVSFDQIRHYGAADAKVAAHLGNALGRMAGIVAPGHRDVLRQVAQALLESASGVPHIAEDLVRLRQSVAWAMPGEREHQADETH